MTFDSRTQALRRGSRCRLPRERRSRRSDRVTVRHQHDDRRPCDRRDLPARRRLGDPRVGARNRADADPEDRAGDARAAPSAADRPRGPRSHRLEPALDLRSGLGAQWMLMAQAVAAALERGTHGTPMLHPEMAVRLSDAVMTGLLLAADHQYRDLLHRPAPAARPASIQRVIDLLHDQPGEPVDAHHPRRPSRSQPALPPGGFRALRRRVADALPDPGASGPGPPPTPGLRPRRRHRQHDCQHLGVHQLRPLRAGLPATLRRVAGGHSARLRLSPGTSPRGR
ncbi:hypothetical protein [Nocardioides convexus]|uniref:hypothetical protein n=1 Tax=Nocardioides convexus TaxID=2712224 RepID=UPI0024182757|nr:hypothetical protein [Nocardioides convexus]